MNELISCVVNDQLLLTKQLERYFKEGMMRMYVLLTTWLLILVTVTAAQFPKDIHYQMLATSVANKAEIREFFRSPALTVFAKSY
ncbi:hypothetical protein DXX93_12155 [Thalassotalea euphylliae]|uniref:Uncharacterized protein n=1 Tax=Thalassotalea euphylliae TaxID=1655234 RepID=A0A3E0TRY5_9GAMM|nr:hypothetical protein [Thalassotalea euphylliae]REL27243.1 hypothetical protein DXX93_12155 [Thalassotalea euphylliae]